ncbi:MAG: hypothetical protein R6U11_01610 [Bacteroidales bacterium]
MKRTKLILKVAVAAGFLVLFISFSAHSQERTKLAVISMDTKGLQYDNQSITSMVHLELEKANVYEVFDKYDVSAIIKQQGIEVDDCFGRTCLVEVGRILGAEKMLSGSAERFGNKIVFVMRLIDVETERIEKTDVMEYIDQQDQIQTMVRLSINNIMGIENDKMILDLLVNYDQPIISSKTTVKLNGPRVGVTYIFGEAGEIMQAPKENGGFNMYPVSNLLGYQFEQQFLSSGDFQALLEFLPTLNGLESGMINPSLTIMLGFRFNKSGFEFGLGPVGRLSKTAYGYYDEDDLWHLKSSVPAENHDLYTFVERIDSRGKYKVSTGMIFAAGKTFRSGYLNVPVNIYYSPRKGGSILGLIVGFNVAKRPKLTKS